jgi:hypothetical protein
MLCSLDILRHRGSCSWNILYSGHSVAGALQREFLVTTLSYSQTFTGSSFGPADSPSRLGSVADFSV